MNLIATSSCPSMFFSTSCLRANIPSVVPLPWLNSCCSSPTSLPLLLLFCYPELFQATYSLATCHAYLPFFSMLGLSAPFPIPLGTPPSLVQVFSNLFVDHIPNCSATASISTCTSSMLFYLSEYTINRKNGL